MKINCEELPIVNDEEPILVESTLDATAVNQFLQYQDRLAYNQNMARHQWDDMRQEIFDKWLEDKNATGPNIFYPRMPNWVYGFESKPFEFSSKEDLEKCEHIQNFLQNGYHLKFSKESEDVFGTTVYSYRLMAVNDKAYWVIGSFKRSYMLTGWYPEWK